MNETIKFYMTSYHFITAKTKFLKPPPQRKKNRHLARDLSDNLELGSYPTLVNISLVINVHVQKSDTDWYG